MKPNIVNYNPQAFTFDEFKRIIKEIYEKEIKPTTYDLPSEGAKREIDRVIKEECIKMIKNKFGN